MAIKGYAKAVEVLAKVRELWTYLSDGRGGVCASSRSRDKKKLNRDARNYVSRLARARQNC